MKSVQLCGFCGRLRKGLSALNTGAHCVCPSPALSEADNAYAAVERSRPKVDTCLHGKEVWNRCEICHPYSVEELAVERTTPDPKATRAFLKEMQDYIFTGQKGLDARKIPQAQLIRVLTLYSNIQRLHDLVEVLMPVAFGETFKKMEAIAGGTEENPDERIN